MARGYIGTREFGLRNVERSPIADSLGQTVMPTPQWPRLRVRLIAMSAEPGRSPEPPPLPSGLLRAWPFITIGALGWLIAVAAAFLVPSLESWRPVALAGLGTGAVGTTIFLLQLAGARRGERGAQTGMETFLDPK